MADQTFPVESGSTAVTGSTRLGRVGFGAMHLSDHHRPPRQQAVALIHVALESGARLIDTADAYCRHVGETGHNERLVAEAVRSWHGPGVDVTIATKGGHVRDGHGGWHVDGRPEYLVEAAERSRERLAVDSIALWHWHRPDPDTPLLRSLAGVAHITERGIASQVGVSNLMVRQLEQTTSLFPVASVQNELSPLAVDSLPEVLWCHRRQVPFLAWAPLSGREGAEKLADHPNVAAFAEVAAQRGTTVYRTILAWLLSLSPVVTVIPGSTRATSIIDNARAAHEVLDDRQVARLDRAAAALATATGRDALAELRVDRP